MDRRCGGMEGKEKKATLRGLQIILTMELYRPKGLSLRLQFKSYCIQLMWYHCINDTFTRCYVNLALGRENICIPFLDS